MECLIQSDCLDSHNQQHYSRHRQDFDTLGDKLSHSGIDIHAILAKAKAFAISIPSWGVGTGGTRFSRFPIQGEPRNLLEKIDDCAVVHQLSAVTPTVSLHIPWDKIQKDPKSLLDYAGARNLSFDAINSNTFQDRAGQPLSYKFGSLTSTSKSVRDQAIAHNIEVIRMGESINSKAIIIWVADGSNFPGQQHFRSSFERYLESIKAIYEALPEDWIMLLEHKIFEPALYSTVLQDWGSSYLAAKETGERCLSLVDLGHHGPTVNIEMIVSRLAHFGKLGGFHFNDSKYGDDDLDSGSVSPYQLFLIFNELVDIQLKDTGFQPSYMLDQSHNVTDPLESLMYSASEVQRAYVKSLLVDRSALDSYQQDNDPLMAQATLKLAFNQDVEAILQRARLEQGGAIEPVACYRASGYRNQCGIRRPNHEGKLVPGPGIV